MSKIKITRVTEEIFKHKGFDHRGCYQTHCNDACCRKGADVDRESFELITIHKNAIEAQLGRTLEACFEGGWCNQNDFLGENAIATSLCNGFCALHLPHGKGCVLFHMILNEGAPKRILPSTCRLYPITWSDGVIQPFNGIETECNCLLSDNPGDKSLWESQYEAISDIFEIAEQ